MVFLLYQVAASGWLTSYRADALTLAAGKVYLVPGNKHCPLFLMLVGDSSRNINDRQQHEHIGLQNCDDNVESHEKDRHSNRDHGKENEGDQIAGENVSP